MKTQKNVNVENGFIPFITVEGTSVNATNMTLCGSIECAFTCSVYQNVLDVIQHVKADLDIDGDTLYIAIVPGIYRQEDYRTIQLDAYLVEAIPKNATNNALVKLMMISEDIAMGDKKLLIGTIAHELRHIWQQTYCAAHYQQNGFGMNALFNVGEIDADGYAIQYLAKSEHITLDAAGKIVCPNESYIAPESYHKRLIRAKEIANASSVGS